MHRALEIPDLLDEILSWLSVPDLAATIRVNQEWFEVSKKFLWENIDLSSALQLLGPKEVIDSGIYRREGHISSHKWRRLILYTPHVRVLYATSARSLALVKSIVPCPYKFEELVVNGRQYLFPKCRFLGWHVTRSLKLTTDVYDMLLPPGLDHVCLTGDMGGGEFNSFYRELVGRLEKLRFLDIGHDALDHRTLDPLDSFYLLLAKFASTLTRIHVPEILFTETTIRELFKLPSLRDLIVSGPAYQRWGMKHVRASISRDLVGGFGPGFGVLEYIYIGLSRSQSPVVNFFQQFSFATLTVVRWDFVRIQFPVDVFLTTIAQSCPNLETLELGTSGMLQVQDASISWPSVKTLLTCKKLTSLTLYCVQVEITLDNFTQLLGSREEPFNWRVIEIFGVKPFHVQEALRLVAKYSPQVHELGLHLHLETGIEPFSDIPDMSLSSPLINGDPVAYIETHARCKNHFRESGFFLPCLSNINFGDSRFMPKPPVGPIASLLLAICKNPVLLYGSEFAFIDKIDRYMAAYYMEVDKLTNQPMTDQVRNFVLYQEDSSDSDFSESDFSESDSSDSDVSSDMDVSG